MATNEELADKYFFRTADETLPSEPGLETFADSLVTPLVDGATYAAALDAALQTVGTSTEPEDNAGEYIYIHGWRLGIIGGTVQAPGGSGSFSSSPGPAPIFYPWETTVDDFTLDGPGGTNRLVDVLKEKVDRGVDVRVMGWMMWSVYDVLLRLSVDPFLSPAVAAFSGQVLTLNTIRGLRDYLGSPGRPFPNAVVNLLGHAAGSVHVKMVVVGNPEGATGFTGGIDLIMNRWATPDHVGSQIWHDAMARVQGPGADHLRLHFIDMWNENLSRKPMDFKTIIDTIPSRLPDTTFIAGQSLSPSAPQGNHLVQGARTIPRHVYLPSTNLVRLGQPPKLPPGAQDGLFEVQAALEKAIRAAETYIYMEDQYFWSNELMNWLGNTLAVKPNLHLVMVTGAPDPDDPKFNFDAIRTQTLNDHLVAMGPAAVSRMKFFTRNGDALSLGSVEITDVDASGPDEYELELAVTPARLRSGGVVRIGWIRQGTNLFEITANDQALDGQPLFVTVRSAPSQMPTTGPADFFVVQGINVHAKTILIDDEWAMIGSANMNRRSFYTDWEHTVTFVDADTVREYRKVLWNDAFHHDNPNDFHVIEEALHSWNPAWGTAGSAPPLPMRPANLPPTPMPLEEIPIPYVDVDTFSADEELKMDVFVDVDSRQGWAFPVTFEE